MQRAIHVTLIPYSANGKGVESKVKYKAVQRAIHVTLISYSANGKGVESKLKVNTVKFQGVKLQSSIKK